MMDKKDLLMLDTVSEIDDQIIDRQSAKRYLLFRAWRKRMRKRNWFIGISSAAASILLLVIGIMLIMQNLTPGTGGGTQPNVPPVGDPKQVPVYQGMTVSNEMPVIESAEAPFESLVLSNSNHVYGNQKVDKDKPFGDNKKPIKDAISDSLQVTGAPEGYFAQAGQTIYITVHFDNPDLFEIWSFTLGGQPKQVGMEGFVVGHDLQTVTVPMIIPADAEGVIEYTIDAIKYVDGTEFKDVRMEGDDTVRVTVYPEEQPVASIADMSVGVNSVSFAVNVTDPKMLIKATEGDGLYAMLYNGDTILAQKELTLGQQSVTFDGLIEDTLYQYAIVGVYDAWDGAGKVVHMLNTQSFITDFSYRLIYSNNKLVGIDFGKTESASSAPLHIALPDFVTSVNLINFPFIIPQCILGEHFDTYIKPPLEKLVEEGGISELDYQQFLDSFKFYNGPVKEELDDGTDGYLYPFMNVLPEATWYVFQSDACKNIVRVREILDLIGFDANSQIEEISALMLEANAYDEWKENRYRFCAGSADKPLSFDLPSTVTFFNLPAHMIEQCGEWENGICYVEHIAIAIDESVTDVTFRAGTTSLGKGIFQNNTTIKSIVFPDGMKYLGSYPFKGCTSLETVTFPESLTEIGYSPFFDYACTSLSDLYFHGGDKNISGMFFVGPNHAVNLHFDSMEDFLSCNIYALFQDRDDKLYVGGELVTELVIPDGMTKMPFWGNPYADSVTVLPQITAISLPDSITSLNSHDFWLFPNLERIELEDISTLFAGGIIPAMRSGVEIYVDGTPVTDLMIPEGITEIPDYAFSNWDTLVSVTLPSGVTSIGYNAFESCNNLTEITIPGTVKMIDMDATFVGCPRLKCLILEEGVEVIEFGPFDFDTLILIKLPSTLQSVEKPYGPMTEQLVIEYNGTIAEWKALCSDWESYYNAGITVRCNDGTLAKNA